MTSFNGFVRFELFCLCSLFDQKLLRPASGNIEKEHEKNTNVSRSTCWLRNIHKKGQYNQPLSPLGNRVLFWPLSPVEAMFDQQPCVLQKAEVSFSVSNFTAVTRDMAHCVLLIRNW